MLLETLSQGLIGKEGQSSNQEISEDKSAVIDALHRQETGLISDEQAQEYIKKSDRLREEKNRAKQEFEVQNYS